ncbi:MAG: hypothetical protein ACJAQZ_004152 [Planctomycetota bacterium]
MPQRNACAEVSKWPQMVAKVLDVDDTQQPPESTS